MNVSTESFLYRRGSAISGIGQTECRILQGGKRKEMVESVRRREERRVALSCEWQGQSRLKYEPMPQQKRTGTRNDGRTRGPK